MKHLRQELWFNTSRRRDYINITRDVEQLVQDSNVEQGICLSNAMHITASVYISMMLKLASSRITMTGSNSWAT